MEQNGPKTVMYLSAVKVRSKICTSGKAQSEIAEWRRCSERQVRNWCRKNTNISVANLYALADCLNCKPEDLLIAVEIPENKV